jgi:hypothetical protein
MSYDGEYQVENNRGDNFATIDDCLEAASDMGSRWFFYPLYFVATDKTIVDCSEQMKQFTGKRINTVSKLFEDIFSIPETQGMDVDEYIHFLMTIEV